MQEINIITVTLDEEGGVSTRINKNRAMVVEVLANTAMQELSEGNPDLLSLWTTVLTRALAAEKSGDMAEGVLKRMRMQIPVLRMQLQVAAEIMEQEEDDKED